MMTRLPLSARNVGFRRCRSSNGSGSALAKTCHSGFPTPVIRYHRSVFYCLAARGGTLLHKCALQQTAVKASTPTAAFAESP